jgi:hypothetical protein
MKTAVLILLFAFAVSAQQSIPKRGKAFTQVAAAAGSFDFNSIAGLQIWIEADSISGSDGSTISSFTEKSGNAYTFSQGTAVRKPKLATNVKNGHSAIFFIGGTNGLESSITTLSQSNSIFIVYCPTNSIATEQYLWNTDAVSQRIRVSGSQIESYSGSTIACASPGVSAWVLIEFKCNGASSTVHTNGVQATSGNAGTQAIGSTPYLGISFTGAVGMMGYIAEVLVYRYTPSDADIATIRSQLNSKYAIY